MPNFNLFWILVLLTNLLPKASMQVWTGQLRGQHPVAGSVHILTGGAGLEQGIWPSGHGVGSGHTGHSVPAGSSGGGPAVIGHPCGSWVWGQLAIGSPPSATGPEHVWGMGQPSAVWSIGQTVSPSGQVSGAVGQTLGHLSPFGCRAEN